MILNFDEINRCAESLAKIIRKGDLIALIGDLGTGKTHFTKTFAKSLGIEENITSPTFTYVKEYRMKEINLFHFDVYRLLDSEELYSIGYEDYLDEDGIIVIEWANIIEDVLPEEYLRIELKYVSEEKRDMKIEYINNKKREKEILDYVGLSDR